MARTLYLPADTTINLTAAKTVASQLSQQATLDDLRTLLEHGWIVDDTLPDPDTCGDDLAARGGHLRHLAEQELHQLLDRFARSLRTREVYRHRFDRDDTVGVDAYTTGGPQLRRRPHRRVRRLGRRHGHRPVPGRLARPDQRHRRAAAPLGQRPAVTTITFRAWAQPDTTA